uniref:Reverse transcriptase domain-containing protein n=1 Tax=Capitella teleta TaxID=283909 RepID=X2B7N5_CAPTE
MVSVVDRISRAFEKGEVVISVLLDFQKAFHTIQYKSLLSKLLRYRIRGTPHRWFTNYLSGRQQRV